MAHTFGRRQFIQAAACVPLASLAASARTAAQEEHLPQTAHTGSSEQVRIGTIQSNRVPTCEGLKTNPFSGDFSLRDLFTSIEKRIEWYEQLLERAASEKCQLAVITEDFTRLGSCMTYLDDRSVFRQAVAKQTPLIPDRLGAVAKKHSMLVVACYFALDGDAIYNVADLFGRDGTRIGRYRKVHLPEYELWQVRAGDAFPAFETDIGWIGMLICYDQMWPESAACCAMNGAQIICQPSAASLTDYHMRTRAMDNQVHHVSSTYANSMIVTPRADIVANAKDQDPALVWADVDIRGATLGDEYYYETLYSGIRDHKERHLKFRRPDAYQVLTEQRPPLTRQYPEGHVANTPDAIAEVYRKHKEAQEMSLRGEHVPYHWRW